MSRKKPIDVTANAQVELLIACLRSLKAGSDYGTAEVRLGLMSPAIIEALVERGGRFDHMSIVLKSEYNAHSYAIDSYALTIERPSLKSGYQPPSLAIISAYKTREATAEELATERERQAKVGT